MIIRCLIRRVGPVLAIDADPSSNLNLVLGLPLDDNQTVGHIREEMLTQIQADSSAGIMSGGLVSGLSKLDYFDYHIRSITVEGNNVDLVAIGRPEGPGCYCPANNALRLVLDRLSNQYPFVVMDNEAGLEHLSRRTTRNVEHLLVITDPGQRAFIAAQRVVELVKELNIEVGQTHLIINLQHYISAPSNPLWTPSRSSWDCARNEMLRAFELSRRPWYGWVMRRRCINRREMMGGGGGLTAPDMSFDPLRGQILC
jgi:CO dehydrogenase maturation factor